MQSTSPKTNKSVDENNNSKIVDDDHDPISGYNRSNYIEPFHRQRRIDGTLSFSEQCLTMQHMVITNGLDGRCTNNENETITDLNEGGIWKQIIQPGIGTRPTVGACVRLHYYAYFEHRDEPFDTSFKRRRALDFRLGKCDVLPGIDMAVRTMQRRERSKFIISSDLLYGAVGCAPHIPESAWCLYVIELLSTNEQSTTAHDEQFLTKTTTGSGTEQHRIDDFAKRIRLAQTLRNTGNEEYANGQLERALRSYNKARQLIHNKVPLIDGKHEEQYHQLLLKLHLNSAQCYLRLDNFQRCFRACRDALVIEPLNIKALYRASVSLRSMNQLDEAQKYLSKAVAIDGQNRDIVAEQAKMKQALAAAAQSDSKQSDDTFSIKELLSNDGTSDKSQMDIDELDEALACIAVSDDFRNKLEILLVEFIESTDINNEQSEPFVVQRQNFSNTEFYYVELLAKRKQLKIIRLNNDVMHIVK